MQPWPNPEISDQVPTMGLALPEWPAWGDTLLRGNRTYRDAGAHTSSRLLVGPGPGQRAERQAIAKQSATATAPHRR